MARSIKSKRGMALRRIKRERYIKKELSRLNKMLGLPDKEDKCDEDIEMTTEDDEKRGLSSKDYKLLKSIVKDGSDSEESDVGKELDEVMVMTSSKYLRKKCQVLQHNDSNRQDADETAAKGETPLDELLVHEVKKLNQRESAKLVNEFGSYPIWMNQKKIKALAKVNRSLKKKKNKRLVHAARKGRRDPWAQVSEDEEERKALVDVNMETEDVTTKTVKQSFRAKRKRGKKGASKANGMETEDVTTKTTEELPKANGESGKKVAAKATTAKRGRRGKLQDTINSSNSEEAVETIDLSE